MESIKKTLIVDAAIWRVFGLWRRLENFPKFIETVREVRWLARDQLLWREQGGDGAERQIVFEVRFDLAQCRVAWQSVSGVENRGEMYFEPLPGNKTLLTAHMQFAADADFQHPLAVSKRLEGYLNGFKKFVEARSAAQKLSMDPSPATQPASVAPEPVRKW